MVIWGIQLKPYDFPGGRGDDGDRRAGVSLPDPPAANSTTATVETYDATKNGSRDVLGNAEWRRIIESSWRYRLTVRTEPSQGLNTGSIPVSATMFS